MPGLSAWAVRRPIAALVSWLVAMIAIITLGVTWGGTLNDSFELPDSESTTAQNLLEQSGSGQSSFGGGATVVWSPASGSAVDADAAARMLPVLTEISELGSVDCVTNQFDQSGQSLGRNCEPSGSSVDPAALASLTPEEQATLAKAFAPVSPDGKVAYATISFPNDGANVTGADAKHILTLVKALNGVPER